MRLLGEGLIGLKVFSLSMLLCGTMTGFAVFGCVREESKSHGEQSISQSEQAIINGELDTEHSAVIAYFYNQNNGYNLPCSGTVIHVSEDDGYVLTAAHCAENNGGGFGSIVIGDNWESGISYPIVETYIVPEYDGSTYIRDFALIRFIGANDTMPWIAAMTPEEDELQAGSVMSVIGYGETENGVTHERHIIDRELSYVTDDFLIYENMTGGSCYGDSGGALLSEVNGELRLSGVTSHHYGSTCSDGLSYSGRVSSIYEDRILPFISNPWISSCGKCTNSTFNSVCFDSLNACGNDQSCIDYSVCQSTCTDQACKDTCATSYPSGAEKYNELISCSCGWCSDECVDDTWCGGPGQGCGLVSNSDDCQTCINNSCCAEASACNDDYNQYCFACFPYCEEDNNAANTLRSCLENSCNDQCPLIDDNGQGGSGGGTTTSSTTTTSTTSSSSTSTSSSSTTTNTTSSATDSVTGTGGNDVSTTAPSTNSLGEENEELSDNESQNSGCSMGGTENHFSALVLLGIFGIWRKRNRFSNNLLLTNQERLVETNIP